MPAAATRLADLPDEVRARLPHIWTASAPRTASELSVLGASAELREKPDWRTKALDPAIQHKWKEEAIAQHNFHPSDAAFLVDELAYEATQWHDEARGIESTGIPAVVRSDRLVEDDLLRHLCTLANELEASTPVKDWHPGSNETVLDVVHPSLYPLADGLTRVFDDEVHFSPDSEPPRHLAPWFSHPQAPIFRSSKHIQQDTTDMLSVDLQHTYQWLPTDFQVDDSEPAKPDTDSLPLVRALSYINNLHPDPSGPSGKLYDVLERVLARFVPMFEATLSEALLPHGGVRREFRQGQTDPFWLVESWNPPEPLELSAEELEAAGADVDVEYLLSNGTSSWDTSENRIEDARHEHWQESRKWEPIPTLPFEPREIPRVSIRGGQLQVIVKMATIHLTPEKPEYEGGSWHVEGTLREKICATGILYFDQENIGPSTLGFRGVVDSQQACESFAYEQNEFGSLAEIYGFANEELTNQDFGSIQTKRARALSFPNGLQHQVAPFRLQDDTKPGHRKILAFFLVHPLETVISTSRVAPQRYDWMARHAAEIGHALLSAAAAAAGRRARSGSGSGSRSRSGSHVGGLPLPAELRRIIVREAAPNAVVPPAQGAAEDLAPRVRKPVSPADDEKTKAKKKQDRVDADADGDEDEGDDEGEGDGDEDEDGDEDGADSGQSPPKRARLELSQTGAAEEEAAGTDAQPETETVRRQAELWAGSGMSLAEAHAFRAELMKERATQADSIESQTPTFNFCEH